VFSNEQRPDYFLAGNAGNHTTLGCRGISSLAAISYSFEVFPNLAAPDPFPEAGLYAATVVRVHPIPSGAIE
jgi:hypothetical protein